MPITGAPETAGPGRGLHICYVTPERELSTPLLGRFTRHGLDKGQRVLWLVERDGRGPLAKAGESVVGGDGQALGAVKVGVAEDAYLPDGAFDPSRMLAQYREELDASLAAGFSGVRVVADATWIVDRPSDFEAFVGYEHRVSEALGESFEAICHYDADRLPPGWARAIREAHPVDARPGDVSRLSAGTCDLAALDDGRVALSGDLDRSNAEALRALLAEHLRDSGEAHLDASGLRFIDVAGTRALVETARRSPGPRIVVHGAPRCLRVILELTGWWIELALAEHGPAGTRG